MALERFRKYCTALTGKEVIGVVVSTGLQRRWVLTVGARECNHGQKGEFLRGAKRLNSEQCSTAADGIIRDILAKADFVLASEEL